MLTILSQTQVQDYAKWASRCQKHNRKKEESEYAFLFFFARLVPQRAALGQRRGGSTSNALGFKTARFDFHAIFLSRAQMRT